MSSFLELCLINICSKGDPKVIQSVCYSYAYPTVRSLWSCRVVFFILSFLSNFVSMKVTALPTLKEVIIVSVIWQIKTA